MVEEVLTIVPPIIVNESTDPEQCGAIYCLSSVEDVYSEFEDWYADESHCAVDSRGQMMKLVNVAGLGLQLRGIGGPDRPDLFRRYYWSIFYQDDPAAMALKEGTLTHEEISKLVMEIGLANAEERKNFTLRRWCRELLRDIWQWAAGRQ
ncbi:MAG TPA: hypothetical protein VG742_15920 [Dongiaceae bacterium]|nr:hypothetical protein [Dongiaceae bacterium]